MRKISLVLVAAMLLSTGSLFANDLKKVEPPQTLSMQIYKMLKGSKYALKNKLELTAQVRFTINNIREIVVMSVDTEDANLEIFVKNRLNYKKVQLDNYRKGKIYIVPVRVKG